MKDGFDEATLKSISHGGWGKTAYSNDGGQSVRSISPSDGSLVGEVSVASESNYEQVVEDSIEVFR